MLIPKHPARERERNATVARVERGQRVTFAVGNASHEVEVGRAVPALTSRERVRIHRLQEDASRRQNPYVGIKTVSMTWMTPFEAGISALTTVAPLTFTVPPEIPIVSGFPSSVVTCSPSLRSAAITSPLTT